MIDTKPVLEMVIDRALCCLGQSALPALKYQLAVKHHCNLQSNDPQELQKLEEALRSIFGDGALPLIDLICRELGLK